METQLATTNNTLSATWGTEGVDTRGDILLPHIVLLSSNHPLVDQGKGRPGDLVNTVTDKVIASSTEWASFAVVKFFKTLEHMKHDGSMFRKESVEPWRSEFYNLTREQKTSYVDEQGENRREDPTLNFYIMLEDDLKSGEGLPCLIKFKRTSTYAGQKLTTYLMLCAKAGKSAGAKLFKVKSEKVQHAKTSYYTFTTSEDRVMPDEYLPEISNWWSILTSGPSVQVQDNDDAEVTPF